MAISLASMTAGAVNEGRNHYFEEIQKAESLKNAEYFVGTAKGQGYEAERKALQEVMDYLQSTDENFIGIGGFDDRDFSYDPETDTTSFSWRIK